MCSKIENNSDSVSHWVRQVTGRCNQMKKLKRDWNIYIYIQKIRKIQKYTRGQNKHVFTATPDVGALCDPARGESKMKG